MEQHLQIIYNAIDRGVQRGAYTAKEAYDVLTAFSAISAHFIPEEKQEELDTNEETAK